jgi:hypothetical protein
MWIICANTLFIYSLLHRNSCVKSCLVLEINMDVTIGQLENAWDHLEAWFRQQTVRIDIATVLTQSHLAGNGTTRK